MASVRLLKKDVNFITNEIIIECFTLDYILKENKEKELTEIIAGALSFQSNTIKAINSTTNTASQPIKKQFANIRTKMKAEVKQLIEKLEKLS